MKPGAVQTLKAYKDCKLHALSPLTLNRLYVALSRSRGNVYLVPQTYMARYKLGSATRGQAQ